MWQAFSDTSNADAPVAEQPQPDANAADDAPAPAEVLATALSRLRAAAESAPVETDAAAALQTLADMALFNVPVFDDAADDATVREARTSSDGKYELPDVAPGDYYVHAQETRGASLIEWCLPVHVPGERRKIVADLDDKNAAITASGMADTASD